MEGVASEDRRSTSDGADWSSAFAARVMAPEWAGRAQEADWGGARGVWASGTGQLVAEARYEMIRERIAERRSGRAASGGGGGGLRCAGP